MMATAGVDAASRESKSRPRNSRIPRVLKKAGVTHVMVHTRGFHQDREPVLPVLEKRGDFALMGIGPDGVRLYRLLP